MIDVDRGADGQCISDAGTDLHRAGPVHLLKDTFLFRIYY